MKRHTSLEDAVNLVEFIGQSMGAGKKSECTPHTLVI
jgi:hypothetical protein